MRLGGKLVDWICFLKVNVTLTMNLAILFSKTTMTAICERMPAFLRPRILGFGDLFGPLFLRPYLKVAWGTEFGYSLGSWVKGTLI